MTGRCLRLVSTLAILLSLVACQSPGALLRTDRQEAADALQRQLGSMPGVARVDTSYELGPFPPAWLEVSARMDKGATREQVLAVVSATYDALGEHFAGNTSASFGVTLAGHHHVALGSRTHPPHPKASVLATIRWALTVAQPGEVVEIDLSPSDESSAPSLDTHMQLSLAPGSTVEAIRPRLAEMAVARAAADDDVGTVDLTIQASDRAAIAGAEGLPSEGELAFWEALADVPAPGPVRMVFTPGDRFGQVDGSANATAYVTLPPHSQQIHGSAVRAMMKQHLNLLRARDERFSYGVEINGDGRMWMSSWRCQRGNNRWQIKEVFVWFYGDRCFKG